MDLFYLVTALVVLSTTEIVAGGDDSVEKYEEKGLASEVVGLLNATYFNINEKVCELQRRVDAIEGGTHSGQQCGCNSTEIQEFKRTVSTEINDFSKIMSGFENALRTMKKEQEELRAILGGGVTVSTTTATTPAPECEEGWILSPGGKCYYVSTRSEKTEWDTAISRCSSKGAKLVEFRTDEEAQFVMRNLPPRVGTNDLIYVGRKRNDADVWVFLIDDEPVDTSMRTWSRGEPGGGEQTCGCTRRRDDFLMMDCLCPGFDLYYICETLLTVSTTTATVTTPAPECEEGWILSPRGKCYFVSTRSERTEWATAISQCSSKGAKLVEFRTDEEAQFVMRNLPPRVSRSDIIYTGRKRNDADVWVFLSDDEPVDTSVRTWGSGEPDRGVRRCGCTRRSDDFLMIDCHCSGFDLYYICETLPDVATTSPPTPTTTTSKSRECQDDWIESPEKCYYVSTTSERTVWATAVSRCKSMGANLVEIKTDEEAEFIQRNMPSHVGSNDLVYTGRERKGSYVWYFLSNSELVDTSVRSWAPGEPDNSDQQTCGCTKSGDNFMMHDCLCTGFNLYYICEIRRWEP